MNDLYFEANKVGREWRFPIEEVKSLLSSRILLHKLKIDTIPTQTINYLKAEGWF